VIFRGLGSGALSFAECVDAVSCGTGRTSEKRPVPLFPKHSLPE